MITGRDKFVKCNFLRRIIIFQLRVGRKNEKWPIRGAIWTTQPKNLTDKFVNRVWRIQQSHPVYIDIFFQQLCYARIDPNMDSISPRIEPDGSNSVHFLATFEWASFLSLFNHTYTSCATVIVLPVVVFAWNSHRIVKKINLEIICCFYHFV